MHKRNRMVKIIILLGLALLMVAGLVMTGCATTPTEPNAVEGTAVGNFPPDFQLKSLTGETITLSELRGQPVLINFWATWCGPCRYEMPFLQQIFADKANERLVILAVNIGETLETADQFVKDNNLSFTVLLDTNRDLVPKYGLRYIPTTFLIGRDGTIQYVKSGAYTSKSELENSLKIILPN
ncbi:MAG: TlpA disulfide reductase family protein [Dehalococcoidales bacterium]|nr:TlpA disulfide reductase family protein [Dehalococcoidales bacterium]